MADIDKITASNGTTYNIKDSTARESISNGSTFNAASTVTTSDMNSPANGISRITASTSNLPSPIGSGVVPVLTFKSGGVTIEFAFYLGTIYVRRCDTSTWGNWYKIQLSLA